MKKFLIIGNMNAVTYKEIFPHIASREIFVRTATGVNHTAMWFINEKGELKECSSVWYTTLDSRHLWQTLPLTKTYDPQKYPRYDNYDAIEVGCVKDIPADYDGVMGVPISIVLFSPEQFEIIKFRKGDDDKDLSVNGKTKYCRVLNQNSAQQTPGETFTYVNGKKKCARVFIEHSHPKADIINGGVFNNPYIDGKQKYQRILIRKKDDN